MQPRTSLVAFCFVVIVCSLLAGSLYHRYYSDRGMIIEVSPSPGTGKHPPAPRPKKKKRGKIPDDVDFGPYMADLQRRIKRAWFPPKAKENRRIVVVFKVHRNGMMSNLRLVKSSGCALSDQAGLKAVTKASPFRPLPKGAPADVDIQFTYDYNVFKKGNKTVKKLVNKTDKFPTNCPTKCPKPSDLGN